MKDSPGSDTGVLYFISECILITLQCAYKESPETTGAIIELMKTLPKNERADIVNSIATKKTKKSVSELTNKEYAKRLKKFNDFAGKNRFIRKDFKFKREEAHERK